MNRNTPPEGFIAAYSAKQAFEMALAVKGLQGSVNYSKSNGFAHIVQCEHV